MAAPTSNRAPPNRLSLRFAASNACGISGSFELFIEKRVRLSGQPPGPLASRTASSLTVTQPPPAPSASTNSRPACPSDEVVEIVGAKDQHIRRRCAQDGMFRDIELSVRKGGLAAEDRHRR